MHRIEVSPTGPGAYQVTVDQQETTTTHEVRVPLRLRNQLGLGQEDEPRLVRESFEFLLDREPASAILARFELDEISRYFPEYPAEIARRLE